MPPASTRCLANKIAERQPHGQLFPTRSIVSGFGTSRTENRRVITKEWIFEGVTLIFAGMLTAAVARVRHDSSTTATAAYAALLIVTTVISLRTAGRNTFIAYRSTPRAATSAILLLTAIGTGSPPPVNRARRRRGRICLTRYPRRRDSLPAGSSGSP